MDINDFISNTVRKFEEDKFDTLKEKLIGEYISFSFVNDNNISIPVFCEKVRDYFEKTEIKTKADFGSILTKYVSNLDKIVRRYIPKEPSAKKGEPTPPVPRNIKYYKYALELKASRNFTMKQLTDYSRIMFCLYMGAINNKMKSVGDFKFSTEEFDLDQIIKALKKEKINSINSSPIFNLKDPYCTDTTTFVIAMIIYYHIKNSEFEEG